MPDNIEYRKDRVDIALDYMNKLKYGIWGFSIIFLFLIINLIINWKVGIYTSLITAIIAYMFDVYILSKLFNELKKNEKSLGIKILGIYNGISMIFFGLFFMFSPFLNIFYLIYGYFKANDYINNYMIGARITESQEETSIPGNIDLSTETLIKKIVNIYNTYFEDPNGAVITPEVTKSESIGSIVWGIINIFFGFYYGIKFVESSKNIELTVYFILFSSVIMGLVILLSGILGLIKQYKLIIVINGILLLLIGVSNAFFDKIVNPLLKDYGYSIESSRFWFIFGLLQIFSGIKSIEVYIKYISSKGQPNFANNPLIKDLIRLHPDMDKGLFEFVDSDNNSNYIAIDADDKILAFDRDLKNYIFLHKKDKDNWKFVSKNEIYVTDFEGNSHRIILNEPYLSYFQKWFSD